MIVAKWLYLAIFVHGVSYTILHVPSRWQDDKATVNVIHVSAPREEA